VQLEAHRAGLDLVGEARSGREVLPLPVKPKLIGRRVVACSISAMCRAPGVQVVALVPVAGPVPPPMKVVTPLARATSACCGQMK
jgi:hypothetical protein